MKPALYVYRKDAEPCGPLQAVGFGQLGAFEEKPGEVFPVETFIVVRELFSNSLISFIFARLRSTVLDSRNLAVALDYSFLYISCSEIVVAYLMTFSSSLNKPSPGDTSCELNILGKISNDTKYRQRIGYIVHDIRRQTNTSSCRWLVWIGILDGIYIGVV